MRSVFRCSWNMGKFALPVLFALVILGQLKFDRAANTIIQRLGNVCTASLYAETDVSETSFLFDSLLSRIGRCGCRLQWRKRDDFSKKYEETRQFEGTIILVATGGPSQEEQEFLKKVPEHQNIILLHPSDEGISQTDPSIYGDVKLTFRNYFHSKMDDSTMDYLLAEPVNASSLPSVLWMQLGLANLRALPEAFKRDFADRNFLWSWSGSTGSKPERPLMLAALKSHKSAEQLMEWGNLHSFNSYAGRPVGSQDSLNTWEYSMLMQQTQFLPLPAGISAEQFRVWEAFEAGMQKLLSFHLITMLFEICASPLTKSSPLGAATGCIPILLKRHVGQGEVLHPLQYLGFNMVLLDSWEQLPDKLLYLHGEVAQNPRQYLLMQGQNSKIWARMKRALTRHIAAAVCNNKSWRQGNLSARK